MPGTILTDTRIKQLKPGNKPYKASDGTIGGLHVAVVQPPAQSDDWQSIAHMCADMINRIF